MPVKANSDMLVLATMTQPAARRRCTTGASRAAGCAFLGQHLGAGARDLAGDVEQVLDGDDGAVERPERNAGLGARVGGVGGGLGGLAIDRQAGARALAFGIVDARERGFETFTCCSV